MIILGWFQLIHQPKRLISAITGITLATWLIFMQTGFESALLNSATALYQSFDSPLFIISRSSRSLSGLVPYAEAHLYRLAGIKGIERVEPIQVFAMAVRSSKRSVPINLLGVGFDPANPPLHLNAEEQKSISTPNSILLDSQSSTLVRTSLVEKFKKEGPYELQLLDRTREVRLEGLFRLGQAFTSDGISLMSDTTLRQALPGRLTSGAIHLGGIAISDELKRSSLEINKIKKQIEGIIPADLEVLTKNELVTRERSYWSKSTAIGFIFRFGTVMGLIVGAVIIYQVLFNDVVDHQHEYATLRAIGFRQTYLQGVIMQEALILSMLGYIPGLVISSLFYRLTQQATGLDLSITLAQALGVWFQIVLTGFSSGILSLRPLGRVDPAEIL